jgi:hypothetical protein
VSLKCAVAIAEQHRDRCAVCIGRRQVQFSVSVEVGHDHHSRIGRGSIADRRLEPSISVAGHDVNTRSHRFVVGDDNVELAVAIKIADRNAAALEAGSGWWA